MLPNINVEFSEGEFDSLKNVKGDREWKDLILSIAVPTNRIGSYNPTLLKKRIGAGQWPEITKALHFFYCELIAETGIRYHQVILLEDAKVIGYRERMDEYDRMRYTALLEVNTTDLTISTFSDARIDLQVFDRPPLIHYKFKVGQDFLLDDNGKIVLDVPVSGSRFNLKRDDKFHREIQGDEKRPAEIVPGFWSERKG